MTLGPRNAQEKSAFAAEEFIVDVQFRLHQLLKAKKITQAELAERLEVSPARVSSFFGPRPNLTLQTIGRILHALDEKGTLSSPTIDSRLQALASKGTEGRQMKNAECNPP